MSALTILFLIVFPCALTLAGNIYGVNNHHDQPQGRQTNGYYYPVDQPQVRQGNDYYYPGNEPQGRQTNGYYYPGDQPQGRQTNEYYYPKDETISPYPGISNDRSPSSGIPDALEAHLARLSEISDTFGQRISERMCFGDYFQKGYPAVGGGIKAEDNEFTHMVAIGWQLPSGDYDYLCGGTLISPYFVLTAAHCRSSRGQKPSVVRTGGGSLNSSFTLHQPIEISDIYVPRTYKRKQIYDDIALIKLKTYSQYMSACLWPISSINYRSATVIGYGQMGADYAGSNDLLKADVQLISNEVCTQFYPPKYRQEKGLQNTQLCAGDFNRVKDTCPGDSGGPIMVKRNIDGKVIPYILGVTSYGARCTTGVPQIYTRVSSYLDWIESIVWATDN